MTRAAFACRSCGSDAAELVLSLGSTPLANALLRPEDLEKPEPRYPLDLVFCTACTLVQITETVPPPQLFGEYLYFSSFSETMLAHAHELVARLIGELALGARSLALEIASNDGYLLQYYKAAGVPVLGIEPAANIARVAIAERGIPTLSEFFGIELARRLVAEGKRADVVHANNVLAHVPDLGGFVAGIREILTDDGVAALWSGCSPGTASARSTSSACPCTADHCCSRSAARRPRAPPSRPWPRSWTRRARAGWTARPSTAGSRGGSRS